MRTRLFWCWGLFGVMALAAGEVPEAKRDAVLLTVSGQVDISAGGTNAWSPGQPNEVLKLGDHLRTGKNSRASVRLSDLSILRVYELTTVEIKPPAKPKDNNVIDIKAGATYFFNRDKPQATQFQTPAASGAIRGTEFLVQVGTDGTSRVSLFNGEVDLENAAGSLSIKSGEEAVAAPGQAPARTAAIVSTGLIQWCLYYPAVLNPGDLELGDVTNNLRDSLQAYGQGDLIRAMAAYPPGRVPASDAERVFRAALLLSVGNVADSRALLQGVAVGSPSARLAAALQRMIAAVTFPNAANVVR